MQGSIVIGVRENIYAVRGDGNWYREKLYLTVAGEWQLVGYGEESTPYHGQKICRIISKEEARLWASNVLGNAQWHLMFD